MASNNTKNPNVPTPSQVDAQSIAGQPPVQVRPYAPGAATNSVTGDKQLFYYDETKGKGNK